MTEGRKFVTYNGTEVIEGWPEKIEATQLQTTDLIGGQSYQRVPYGSEANEQGADLGPCHDCAVIKGQLHVPMCDVEECPACGGQAISCDCVYDDYEEDEADEE